MKRFSIILLAVLPLLAGCHKGLEFTSDNVDETLAKMTTEEKISIVVGAGNEKFLGYGSTKLIVPGAAGTTAPLQRLGIGPTVLTDGPAGIRIDTIREGDSKRYYYTGFPIATALSSSWNTQLVEQVGSAIGSEAHAYGLDLLFAPGMNLHRDPLGGRNWEYYSEDPLLSGTIGAAYVNGVQKNGVGACPKHYAVNNQETNRKDVDVRIAERPLYELYLRNFEITVRKSKPWAVMSAYNAVNGEQCMESHLLLTDVLRGKWHFDGIVVTDWAAPGWRDSGKEITAGNDLLVPGTEEQRQELRDALKSGALKMADLDTCARRVLRFVARTSRQQGYEATNEVDLKTDAAMSLKAADEAVVLLQNDNQTLPLQKSAKSVGLFGITSYFFIANGSGSGNVKTRHTVSLLEGLENVGLQINSGVADYYQAIVRDTLSRRVYNELGYEAIPESPIDEKSIEQSALSDDIAMITIGRSCGEGIDRNAFTGFNLLPMEKQMISSVSNAFHKQGKRVLVILNVPGPVEVASWRGEVDAIVCAWMLGQESGTAVCDVLTGKVCPSGRLPMTWSLTYEDCNTSKNFPYDFHGPRAIGNYKKIPREPEPIKNVHYVDYDEGIYVGYRYFDTFNKDVAYPFGYGQSYASFEYSDASVRQNGDDSYSLTLTVKNTSAVSGKEVVQVYAPVKGISNQLIAFGKTDELAPGKSQKLTLTFTKRDLSYYDVASHDWKLDRGQRTLSVSRNSRTPVLKLNLGL